MVPITEGMRGFILFPKGISSEVNVKAQLEFELAYFNVTVQHVNHYITGTSPNGSVHFLCLMTYKPLWVTECHSHPCRRTEVMLFNLELDTLLPCTTKSLWRVETENINYKQL